jgi:hypothetical protein
VLPVLILAQELKSASSVPDSDSALWCARNTRVREIRGRGSTAPRHDHAALVAATPFKPQITVSKVGCPLVAHDALVHAPALS